MRLNRETKQYITEYQERIDRIPENATELVDHRSFGVGPVYYTIGQDIYIANYTGSDVPEWAVQYYSFVDALDADPSNAEIIGMLTAPTPKRARSQSVLCDCGHYTTSPMSASMGTSCPDCYDRMSD